MFNQQRKLVHYYALDVSLQGLANSIIGLTNAMGSSQYVKITGLLGTYEDCVSWLSGPNNLRDLSLASFLWMGNSIANFNHYSEAGAFLSKFRKACEQSSLRCQFIVSVDICQDAAKVAKAYSLDLPEFRDFLLNGLVHSNTAVGHEMFRYEDWSCELELSSDEHGLGIYYAPQRDVEITPSDEGPIVAFSRGQRVKVITSGKWNETVMKQMGAQAGLHIQGRWKDVYGDYCKLEAII